MLNALKMVEVDVKNAYYRRKANRELRKLKAIAMRVDGDTSLWRKQANIALDVEKKWFKTLTEKDELYSKASLSDYVICGLLEGAIAGTVVIAPLVAVSNLINRVGA